MSQDIGDGASSTTCAAELPPLLFENRYLTQQQSEIVRYQTLPGHKIVVNAYAGCGKTTTMRALVNYKHQERLASSAGLQQELDPDGAPKRFLYVVYNVDMEQTARKAFQADDEDMAAIVKVCTYHALALSFFRHTLADRNIFLDEGIEFDFEERGGPFGYLDRRRSRHKPMLDIIRRFCQDPCIEYDEPQPIHTFKPGTVPADITIREHSLSPDDLTALQAARQLWHEAIDCRRLGRRKNSETGVDEQCVQLTHWIVLKYFTLHADAAEQYVAERFHTMLVDEAQDVQRPLMAWLLDHVTLFPIYLVGDTFQSIYAFSGAHDAIEQALKHSQSRRFDLSQSFRFGSTIARGSSALLHVSGRLQPHLSITGNDAQRGCGTVYALSREAVPELAHELIEAVHARTGSRDIALLTRLNKTVLTAAIAVHKRGYHVKLAGKTVTDIERGYQVLKKYPNETRALERVSALMRKAQQLESVQLDYRKALLLRERRQRERQELEQRTENASGKQGLQQELDQNCTDEIDPDEPERPEHYYDRGFVKGGDLLSEWESFERTVLVRALQAGYDVALTLYRGLYEQSTAKNVPTNTVCVTICTVHAAKGCEWDAVVLMDDFPELSLVKQTYHGEIGHEEFTEWMNREAPHANNLVMTRMVLSEFHSENNRIALGQEMHLCYVAMTRAKHHLYVNPSTASLLKQVFDIQTMPMSTSVMESAATIRHQRMQEESARSGGFRTNSILKVSKVDTAKADKTQENPNKRARYK